MAEIDNSDADQATKDELKQEIQNSRPNEEFFGSDEQSVIEQALASAFLSGGGAYLANDLAQYYSYVSNRMIVNVVPDRHLGEAIETALLELNPPANQTFPKVGAIGKAMGPAGIVLGLGIAANSVYEEYQNGGDWQGEAIKQASILGTSTAIGMGIGVFAGGVPGAVAGALIGSGVGYAMDYYWDDIVDITKAAADAGKSAADAVADVVDGLQDSINGFLEDPSGHLQDMLDFGEGLLDDLADLLPVSPTIEAPDWLTNLPVLDVGGTIGFPANSAGGGLDPLVFDLDGDGQTNDNLWVIRSLNDRGFLKVA